MRSKATIVPGVRGTKAACVIRRVVPCMRDAYHTVEVSFPAFVVGEDVVILDAGARLGHQLGDGVASSLVVGRLLLLRRIRGRPINFDQYRIYVPSRLF